MKGFLVFIFCFIQFYCYSHQTTKTHFNDLKEALKQPDNVTSLYVDYDDEEKFDLIILKRFDHLSKLELSDFNSEVDFENLFSVLAELTQVDTLQLSHCSLTAVPDQIGRLQFLTYLRIHQCHRLTSVSNEIKQLKNLTYLDLSSNAILTLPNVFDSLKSLKLLELNSNMLTELPESICSLKDLESIQLHHNKLVALPEKFIKLKQLKNLSLSANPITHLPINFQQLLLEEIYLGENQFNVFPYQIFDIITLKKISIFNTDVDSLPHSITKMENLEYIFLNLNHAFIWKDAFVKLSKNKKLTQLKIHGYGLENIPEEISLLKNLKLLHVQGFANTSTAINYFSSMTGLLELELPYYKDVFLPPSIGALNSLKVLKMEYCHIQTLPPTIAHLISLEELYLTKYPAESLVIPNEIGSLVNLKIIDFTRCQIKSFPVSISNLKQLKSIDLFGNDLTSIPDELLEFKLLEKLDLSGNKITSIPNWIGQLKYLKEIYLWENKIETVPSEVWEIGTLEILLLHDNNILEFEIPDLPANHLREVSLSDNINLKVLPEFICQLSNLEYLGLECTQIKELPVCVKQCLNLKRISLSENLIGNKKALENACGGKIQFRGECEQLTRLTVNFHDFYGKVTTDIKTKHDSITLYYHYSYNEPDKRDEEYDENVFFVLNKAEVKTGSKYILPDSLVRVLVMHLSIWDMLLPEFKFKYGNLQGEISFTTVKRNKIKTYINLYCDGYNDTKQILIDHKTIVFKKKR